MINEDKKDFAGKNGFTWWIGFVESRQDPLKLGRCKVRCVGWHAEDKMRLPTDDLPWAMPAYPVNHTQTYAPKEGDMVFGFFVDGENAQEPVMLGSFPSIPLKGANIQDAFSDPRSDSELSNAPRTPESKTYNDDGTGIEITEKDKAELYPRDLDEPTTSRIARNDSETIAETFIQERKDNIVTSVPTVNSTWDEPETMYDAVYPYNNVMESESGHLVEFDDTPGAERIHQAHRNGSFQEWFPDGDKVEKITKKNYRIIMSDDHLYVMGKCFITVQGDSEIYVKQNAYLKVDGNVEEVVEGSYDLNVTGDVRINGKTINLNKGTMGAARVNDPTLDNDTEKNGPDDGKITSGSGTVFIGD